MLINENKLNNRRVLFLWLMCKNKLGNLMYSCNNVGPPQLPVSAQITAANNWCTSGSSSTWVMRKKTSQNSI